MTPDITEKQLSDNIVALARILGWRVHRDPTWRATGADAGYPDLTLVRQGRVIFAELKAEKGRLTADQIVWAHEFSWCPNDGPIQYREWRPADWYAGDVEAVLR